MTWLLRAGFGLWCGLQGQYEPAGPAGGVAHVPPQTVAVPAAPSPESLLTGWAKEKRAAYLLYEQGLNAHPTSDSLREFHILLASEPHVAGTPGDAREIERLRQAFEGMKLPTAVFEFWPYLCAPVAAQLDIVAPEAMTLELKERVLKEDASSDNQSFGWNAYSGSGDVTADVVYANFGTKADFEKLAQLKVEVKGKIVLARYGGNFRGYKARFAEAAGAAGLIIYTDPGDSGYMKGLTYPEGGFANDCCIQRGSILTLPYQGDPLTPGIQATEKAERLDPAKVDLPHIPVQPVGWAAAKELMSRMTGTPVPEGWQGGMPFTYRLDGGEGLKVHLKVEQQRAVMKTADVIATLKGSMYPEQMVIVGCHHDAWNCGASDPLCGTIALLESAKAFAAEAAAGHAPLRTIVFAAWGAEEFGIMGSTEWAEANASRLRKNCVAYINLDMASMGTDFGSSASPSLRGVIAGAAGVVAQPGAGEGHMVLEAWRGRGVDFSASWHGGFGDLGGGSDHVAFLCHLGIPSCTLGGSGSKGWSYHSAYDTLPWYWKVVGTDYASALMVTRMTSTVASRLANAPVIPVSPARIGVDTRHQLEALTKKGVESKFLSPGRAIAPEFAPLEGAAIAFEARAGAVMEKLNSAASGDIDAGRSARINQLLIDIDRAWLDEGGLRGREWYKNLYAAPDEDSGYASWILPGLCRALDQKDAKALESEEERCLRAFERMRGIMEELAKAAG